MRSTTFSSNLRFRSGCVSGTVAKAWGSMRLLPAGCPVSPISLDAMEATGLGGLQNLRSPEI
eukprot:9180688-Lingulodinium_polyedra.AAC.1